MLAISFLLQAQDEKLRVAVFDPTSSSVSIDGGTKEAVRELISSTFVNTGKYIMVERSMLQQIMREQNMSNTDAFDDSQATELGKLAGAHKVVLSVVSTVGGRNMLSVKIIDVKTATIDQQKTRVVSADDLLDAVEPLTAELLKDKNTNISDMPAIQENSSSKKTIKSQIPVVKENPVVKEKQIPTTLLDVDGWSVFANNEELTPNEIQKLLAGSEAWRKYSKGISKKKKGNTLLIIGGSLVAVGALVAIATPFKEEKYNYYGGNYYDYYYDYGMSYGIGTACIVAGIGTATTGWIIKANGKRKIRNAVNMYNSGEGKYSNIDFKIGFTGNGVGLALGF